MVDGGNVAGKVLALPRWLARPPGRPASCCGLTSRSPNPAAIWTISPGRRIAPAVTTEPVARAAPDSRLALLLFAADLGFGEQGGVSLSGDSLWNRAAAVPIARRPLNLDRHRLVA